MGLIEVLVSIVIAMLLVLVIYQIYEVSESQKRTITAGSDAQQNAAYGLYVLGRDLAIAGNGLSSATALKDCAVKLALPANRTSPDPLESLRPIPVVIRAGATDNKPDEITVAYGGSGSLSTPVPFRFTAATDQPYVVSGPVAFSPKDVIVAVQVGGGNCTLSTINTAGVAVDPATGFATLTHTPFAGDIPATFTSGTAVLINLGPAASMTRVVYSADVNATNTLRAQSHFALDLNTDTSPSPVVSDVVNLKAQYGVDSNCDGVLTWQTATGAWSSDNVPTLPLPTSAPFCTAGVPSLRQIQAVRIAIVTRSAQYERDPVTAGPLKMFDDTVSMTLSADEQHYRYKVLETVVPLRNALWNPS